MFWPAADLVSLSLTIHQTNMASSSASDSAPGMPASSQQPSSPGSWTVTSRIPGLGSVGIRTGSLWVYHLVCWFLRCPVKAFDVGFGGILCVLLGCHRPRPPGHRPGCLERGAGKPATEMEK